MSLSLRTFLWISVFLVVSGVAAAAPYIGQNTFTYRQPDGSAFSVKLYGDEFFAYQETLDGFVITRDPKTNYWCYATLDLIGNSFISTGIPVTNTKAITKESKAAMQALGVQSKLRLPDAVVLDQVRDRQRNYMKDEKGRFVEDLSTLNGSKSVADTTPAPPSRDTVGRYVGLTILIDFLDQPATIPVEDVELFFNQKTGYGGYSNACSIREYFDIQSGGLLDHTNILTTYVRVSKAKSYYDDGTDEGKAQELVEEALSILVAGGFDFTALSRDQHNWIKCINIFYAGHCSSTWSKGLWPHSGGIAPMLVDADNNIYAQRYQMTDMGNSLSIGTVAHEIGHMLCGFPDLYSYKEGHDPIVGFYSLMASGNNADNGRHPTNIDPYLKMHAGWATVIDALPGEVLAATIDCNANTFYRYRNPEKLSEYFLWEVRGPFGYEGANVGGAPSAVSPTAGLVCYHALETGSNTYSSLPDGYGVPYELLVIEAQPLYNDPAWPNDPAPDYTDSFYSAAYGGRDYLDDLTSIPSLKWWANDGRTLESGCAFNSVSPINQVMTFNIGYQTPVVTAIIPDEVMDPEVISVRIDGSGFVGEALGNSLAQIRRSDTLYFPGTSYLVESANTMYCDFDLTDADVGLWDVVVTNPGGFSGTLPGGFTITTANNAPNMASISDYTINEAELLTFQVSANDPDDNFYYFYGINLPEGARIDSRTGVFSWVPHYEQQGDHLISLVVRDVVEAPLRDLRDIESFIVTVNNTNRTPVLSDVGNQVVFEGQTLSFTLSGSDPDLTDTVTLSAENLPPGASFTPSTGLFTWTPNFEDAGSYTGVRFIATDNSSPVLTASYEITITVYNVVQMGTVIVDVTPNTASWFFTDGEGGPHSGTGDATLNNVPIGSTAMLWNALPGYDTPAPQTKVNNGTVTFTGVYTRHAGAVNVSVTPDTASWTFTDGDGQQHAGTGDDTVVGVPAGTVTLTWNSLTGYTTPAQPAAQTLAKDGSVSFSSTYTRHRGTVNVAVTPDTASWSFVDGDGVTHSGSGDATLPNIPTGGIALTWGALSNYHTPAQPALKALTESGSVTFTGTYTRHTGTVQINTSPDTATWSFVDGDGATHTGTGDATRTVPTGSINLTWQDLTRHDTPAQPATQTLVSDGTVTFTGAYRPHQGVVIVTVTPDIAPWSFVDDLGATHSGMGSSTETEITIGNVAFSWNALANYDAPAQPAAQTLEDMGTVTFSGAYTRHQGTVVVDVTPDTATWHFHDGDGTLHLGAGDAVLSDVPTGTIPFTWKSHDGYATPAAPAAQSLAKDGTITYTVSYVRDRGTVQVNVTPDTASWSFTDGDGATHSGTGDSTLPGIPTGEVALNWDPLAGYVAPAAASPQTLINTGMVSFMGDYTRETGFVVVDPTPDTASWTLTDGDGETHTGSGKASLTGICTGTISIAWDDIENYTTPDDEDQDLTADSTVMFQCNYSCIPVDVPIGINASDGAFTGLVQVSWGAVEGATGYRVYRDGIAASGWVTATSYTDFGADAATVEEACPEPTITYAYHTYQVQARNVCEESALSAADVGHTGANTAAKYGVNADVIWESALPADTVYPTAALAVRILADEAVDPATVTAEVAGIDWTETGGVWRASTPGDDSDGWVIFESSTPWPAGETLTMTVQASTIDGTLLDTQSADFTVIDPKELDAADAPFLNELTDSGITQPLGYQAAPVYQVGPAGVYGDAITVWLPVPEGADPAQLQLLYYSDAEEHRGWHYGENVIGWLAESGNLVEEDGVQYLEISVNHAATLTLTQETYPDNANADLGLLAVLLLVMLLLPRFRKVAAK